MKKVMNIQSFSTILSYNQKFHNIQIDDKIILTLTFPVKYLRMYSMVVLFFFGL